MTAAEGPERKLTAEDLRRFLATPAEDTTFEPYRAAAAVLSVFDPFTLQPVGGGDSTPAGREAALDALLARCDTTTQVGLWTLNLPERRASLRRLATRQGMRHALQANPKRTDTPVQRMFERLLDLEPIALGELSRDEVGALLTAHDWVDGILDRLPEPAAIRKALTRCDLLAPMKRLAGSGFVGRERELQQLEQYVLRPKPRAPLFVFGTGGVGKSTLLARFVLQHALPKELPVAYLDIDRATLRPEQPLTLLLDMLAQLRPQLDWPKDAAESLVKEITFGLGRKESDRHLESAGPPDSWILSLTARQLEQRLGGRTAVLIVDTFEEAQFLGADVVGPLLELLFELDRSLQGLRLIVSGRTLPVEYSSRAFPLEFAPTAPLGAEHDWLKQIPEPDRPINLGVLDDASAKSLLRLSLHEGGLPPLAESELSDVIAIVSRNPMCLKLAARLLRDEGVEKLRGARSTFLAKLKAEKIQGLLYGRILRHVHGEDVRKVAYPGLIVRRIDADLIRAVLARPCGLSFKKDRNEHTIFSELQKEAALVEVDPEDGSLRHRADVRRAMLEDLIDHVRPAIVGAIDRAAVRYYKDRPGKIARAEELYHRLRRGEPTATLDERWTADAAPRLKGALEELPTRQRLWLADRLNVTLDATVRETADLEAWERQAARSADRLLRARAPEQALAVLHERRERSARSALYALEAESYRFLGRFDEAIRVARAGVEAASSAGMIDMALELLLKMVVIEESRGNLTEAGTLMDEAAAVALHSANELLRLRAQVTQLRLQRQLHPKDRSERAELRQEARGSLTSDLLRELRGQPVLLREVAAEVAKQDPRVAALAIETLGIEVGTDAQAQALGRAIAALEPDLVDHPVLADGAVQFKESGFDPTVIRTWATEILTSRDTRKLSGALAGTKAGDKVLSGFREYFRAGVTSSLKGGSGIGGFGQGSI